MIHLKVDDTDTRYSKESGLPTGVFYKKNRIIAIFTRKESRHCLGTFDTPEEAHAAYLTATTMTDAQILVYKKELRKARLESKRLRPIPPHTTKRPKAKPITKSKQSQLYELEKPLPYILTPNNTDTSTIRTRWIDLRNRFSIRR